MRPLRAKRGMLTQALDEMLGAPATIRVLRVFCLFGGPLSAGTVSQRAGISRNATWTVLRKLVDHRLLTSVGQGRAMSYKLDEAHPFAVPMCALFATEHQRAEAAIEAAREVAAQLSPPPRAVWLYGSVARNEDDALSDMDLAIYTDDTHAKASAESLRAALEPVALKWQVTPSVVSLSPSRITIMRNNDATFLNNLVRDSIVIFGMPPQDILPNHS